MSENRLGSLATRTSIFIALLVAAAIGVAVFVGAPFTIGRQTAPERPVQLGATAPPSSEPAAAASPVAPAPPVLATRAGAFNNQGPDPVSGSATLSRTPEGKLVLSLAGLNSTPGPDLYVYLTRVESPSGDAQVKSGIEVGKLKATRGDINYELDSGLDPSQFRSVVVYCKSFSVVFGFANLK